MAQEPVVSNIRFLILIFLFAGIVNANSSLYQMMPGSYKIDMVITDSEESYPVSMKFKINDKGFVQKGSIVYPTYDCKSVIKKSKQSRYMLTMYEKMTFGNDICSDSKYDIIISPKRLFQPTSSRYFSLQTYDEGSRVDIKVQRYSYQPNRYAKLRLRYKIKNIDEVLNSHNSTVIRKYLKYSNDSASKKLAKKKLKLLIAVENKKFDKIKNSQQVKVFEKYIASYPGSSHIASSRRKIASIKKALLIASYRKKSTPKSFYKAYKLSKDMGDIFSLLNMMKDLKSLQRFVASNKDLMKMQAVKAKFAFFYRQEHSFAGYIKAYNVYKDNSDIQRAYEVVASSNKKQRVDKNQLYTFYRNYVVSVANMDDFLIFLNKLDGVDKKEYYIKLMGSKGFGKSVTMENFFKSNEYKKILHKFKPSVELSPDKASLYYVVKYKNKSFYFSVDSSCKYSHMRSKKGHLGLLESMFSSATGAMFYYKVYDCKPLGRGLKLVKNFEKKLLGKSNTYNLSWTNSVYAYRQKIYPERGTSSASVGSGSKKYTCKFHCTGQWESYRGGEHTAISYGASEMEAEDNVKKGYESMCKKYPFYKGGGGTASVGRVRCSSM